MKEIRDQGLGFRVGAFYVRRETPGWTLTWGGHVSGTRDT